MKSRKLGLFGKRNKKRAATSPKKLALRHSLVESLEKRELLNADPALGSAFFFDAEAQATVQQYIAGNGGSESGGGDYRPEGGPSDIVSVAEVEPNDGFAQSQYVPLDGNLGVNITGNNATAVDEDWVSFDLQAGDILDARLIGGIQAQANVPLVSLYDSSQRELVSSIQLPSFMPPNSPLTGSASAPGNIGDVALNYVVPTDGRYHIRTSDVLSSYTIQLRQYRPALEAETAGTKQILYLDFDGAIVSRATYPSLGAPAGSARLSPLSNYLTGYGLQQSDEAAFIDEIVRRVQAKFDNLGANTTNPNYGIEIRNSKDHADPWGQANVSRIIVGGTFQELMNDPAAPLGLLGIAETIDVGSYDTTETALVMNDVLLATFNTVNVSSSTPRMEAIAELMAFVIAHEGGHFFGAWHQDPFNNVYSIMDQFYDPAVVAGQGVDGIFGTADDIPFEFRSDTYSLGGGYAEFGGVNDVVSSIGWGLTTGGVGGQIHGNVFHDVNLNRTLDSGDRAGPSVHVWADDNRNGVLDSGETFTRANSAGAYSLTLAAGTHHIRAETWDGWRATTSPTADVTVALNGSVSGINFGFEQLDTSITGMKWNDSNANGLRDTGESGIEGVWIYIDLDGDNRIDIGEPSAQTSANGTYTLPFPTTAGTYSLREVVDPGYVQTYPTAAMGYEHTVVITGNVDVDRNATAGLNFGNTLTVDFGDAPISYGEAAHGFLPELRLGSNWDAEQSSQYSVNATGDDNNGALDGSSTIIDDEDGVTLSRPLVRGSANNRVSVVANNTTGASAFLNAWIDYNQDGDFDASEQIFTNTVVASGTSALTFSAPADAALGNTFARFRYSSESGVAASGTTGTGEVEDYLFTVVPTLEIAVDDNASVSRNSVLNPIDVLANDFQLPGETLQIVSTSSTTAGGIATISTDNRVLYTPPSGFIGQDTFEYTVRNSGGDIDTANVTVDINLFFANPLAVDDSFEAATDSVDFPLNVLANDIEGQNGALTIISVTQPDKGGQISIATGGKSLRYTPLRSFGGTEFFTYTVADGAGNQSSAQVTLHTLPGDRADDDIQIRLVARDLAGNAITAIPQGQMFKIDVMVDDLRFDAANPGSAAGVFAAFTDLLYDLQLVSTVGGQAGGLNFNVEFFNQYVNGRSGDASVPGIIDEFGSFFEGSQMNRSEPTLLASVTFEARSPGIASFMPDPADTVPASDSLLFDTPSSAVPRERIQYLGTDLEIVGDGAEFPVAVDDSVPQTFTRGSIQNPIDVLSNDLPGSTGSISIVGFDAATTNGGQVALNGAGTALLYTPRSDFDGADQFTYTIQDTRGIQSAATVTVRVGAADANDIVELKLQATDVNGSPIDQITVGSQFQLRGYVQDLRTSGPDLGVFAAYEDVLYSSSLVSPVTSTTNDPNLGFQVSFGPNYQRVREGDVRTLGVINEIGAVSTVDTPLGNGEQLLFVVTLTANSVGTASFIADPSDISPLHDTLTYEPVSPVPFDQISYGFDSLVIVSSGGSGSGEGYHNSANALDVNADGFVSPIDALSVINRLNKGDSGLLGGAGEGEEGAQLYIDTNDDGYLSPIDALLVINHLNIGGSGEGEGADLLSAYLSAGSMAASADGVSGGDAASDATPELTTEKPSAIGSRMTPHAYGPSYDVASATDSIFDTDSEDMDTVLAQLAPTIEENWKKRV